jgi:hypothetical protein
MMKFGDGGSCAPKYSRRVTIAHGVSLLRSQTAEARVIVGSEAGNSRALTKRRVL